MSRLHLHFLRSTQSWLLILAAASLCALYWWQFLASQAQTRATAVVETSNRARQVADVVALQVDTLFSSVDLSLQYLATEYVAHDTNTFDVAVRNTINGFPKDAVTQVGVTDAAGMLQYSSLPFTAPVDLSDREHIKVHFGTGAPKMFVSAPVLGRVSKQWTIQFSRPMFQAGKFTGVIVMSITPGFIADKFIRVAREQGDSVNLVRLDGRWLARSTDLEKAMTTRVPTDRVYLKRPMEKDSPLRVSRHQLRLNRRPPLRNQFIRTPTNPPHLQRMQHGTPLNHIISSHNLNTLHDDTAAIVARSKYAANSANRPSASTARAR